VARFAETSNQDIKTKTALEGAIDVIVDDDTVLGGHPD
jgi:hypothetical protein